MRRKSKEEPRIARKRGDTIPRKRPPGIMWHHMTRRNWRNPVTTSQNQREVHPNHWKLEEPIGKQKRGSKREKRKIDCH